MSSDSVVPRVTVLMSVYNNEQYLGSAVESILNQTFTDFEFLIVLDGSEDGSSVLLEQYAANDSRIRIFTNDANSGLSRSLNRGIDNARGTYIARMDADDISTPDRFASQVAFMDANPEIDLCGSAMSVFSASNQETLWIPPATHNEIISCMIFESVIYHPTVMVRRSLFENFCLRYSEEFRFAQDYELWSRLSRFGRLANLQEVLLSYRVHENSIGEKRKTLQVDCADRVRANLLGRLGIVPTWEETKMHRALSLWRVIPEKQFVLDANEWLLRLSEANDCCGAFPELEFERALSQRWRYICFQAAETGFFAYNQLQASPLYGACPLSISERLKMMIRCLLGRSRGRNNSMTGTSQDSQS